MLFNRFYQPDFDIETLEVRPTLHFSTPSELLPRLHWAAILYGNMKADLAITGGVHSAEDVLKGIMAGAGITMMASALHIHGIEHIKRVLDDVHTGWRSASTRRCGRHAAASAAARSPIRRPLIAATTSRPSAPTACARPWAHSRNFHHATENTTAAASVCSRR